MALPGVPLPGPDPDPDPTQSSSSTTVAPSTTTTETTTPPITSESTTSSTTETSTSSTDSSSSSSSATESSTESTPSSTTESSTSTTSESTSVSVTPTPTPSQTLITSNSNGIPVTSTSTVLITPPPTSDPGQTNAQSNNASKGFFSNTGAVAGVFTVVGLVAVVIIVALITNAIRRRRAKKLDREIAEAAAEAAGAQPAFTDDDYYPDDRYGKGGPGSGEIRSMTTGYSDTTHGTFAQQPMGHGESYNMAELSPYDYGAGAAGAAGIGAMGLNRARSVGQNNPTQPYNAFAGPQPSMPNPYDDTQPSAYTVDHNLRYHQRGPGGGADDLLDAAGLGAGAAGGAAAGYAAAAYQRGYGQPQGGTDLGRNPSVGPSQAAASPLDYSSAYGQHPQVGYPQQYSSAYNPFTQPPPHGYQSQPQPQPYGGSPPRQQSPTPSVARPTSMVDPYGGYVEEPAALTVSGHVSPQHDAHLKAPSPPPERLLGGNFASPPPSSEGHEDNRVSYQDNDDYGTEPRRVLKVANE